ncbi:hypothetical protein AAE478_006295 [Parahypoxylon ruwenzoriense]
MKNRAEHWLPDNIGYRFLAEARRLFDLEQGNPTITTVQAAAIINSTCNINGIDDISWIYMYKSLEMAQMISLFSPSPDESKEWQVAAGVTAWSLFNWQAFATFHTFQPPIIKDPPTRPLPEVDDTLAYYGEIWMKYPLAQEPIPIYNGLVFRAISQFRVIMNEITKLSFGLPKSFSRMSLEAALGFRARLLAWYENLPEPLQARNIALPSHLKLHIHYHILLMSLFEPFMQMGHVHADAKPSTIISYSRTCFETLMRVYYLRHGFESMDTTLGHFLHLLAFSALRDISSVEIGSTTHEAMRSTLVLCAKGLWDQGHNYYISKAIFHLFRQSMDINDVQLLRGITEVEESDITSMERMTWEIRSRWPIGIFSLAYDNGDRTLNHFVHWLGEYLRDRTQDIATSMEDSPNAILPRYPQHYGISFLARV